MRKLQLTLLALLGTSLIIIVAITAGAISSAGEERDSYEQSTRSYQRLLLIEDLITTLFESESSQRALLLTGEQRYLREHVARRKLLVTHTLQLEQTRFPEGFNPALVSSLRDLITQRTVLMDRVNSLLEEEGPDAAGESLRSFEALALMESIREVSARLTAAERSQLQQRDEQAQSHAERLVKQLIAGAIVSFMLLAGAYLFTRRSLRRNRTLVSRLNRNALEISCVNELSSSLQSCGSLQEAGPVLQHYMQRLFPDIQGRIYLMRASPHLLQLSASWNLNEEALVEPIELHDCWALRLGKTHANRAGEGELACTHHRATDNAICIPLQAQSDLVGLLTLILTDPALLPEVSARAELMATHTSAALASISLREALQQQSNRDPLTNLFNRRYLEESLERELLRARRRESSVSIIMLDVDHFKRFNDNHGHPAGDLLLTQFAEYLRKGIRGDDIPCRYGGEEFLLVLAATGEEEALARAEMLRQNMNSMRLSYQGIALPTVTASFGVATFPDHADNRESLIRRADAALYVAKRSGRDRVCVSTDSD